MKFDEAKNGIALKCHGCDLILIEPRTSVPIGKGLFADCDRSEVLIERTLAAEWDLSRRLCHACSKKIEPKRKIAGHAARALRSAMKNMRGERLAIAAIMLAEWTTHEV